MAEDAIQHASIVEETRHRYLTYVAQAFLPAGGSSPKRTALRPFF